jgi:hypothetical protein
MANVVDRMTERLLTDAGIQPEMPVLDVGCALYARSQRPSFCAALISAMPDGCTLPASSNRAYLLMLLIGVTMWIGAKGEAIWRWSVISIVAHCIPLLAIFSLWNVLADGGYLGMTVYSYFIHGVWIAIEAISLWITVKQRGIGNKTTAQAHF